jgi:hypothetical protein
VAVEVERLPGEAVAWGKRAVPADAQAPAGFKREATEEVLRISWKSARQAICIVGGIIGLAFTGAFAAGLAYLPAAGVGLQVICVAGAVLSSYTLLVGLFNRTAVTVRRSQLTARNGPLPCVWPRLFQTGRSGRLRQFDIYRVWAEKERLRHSQNGKEPTYGLAAMTIASGREELLTGLRWEEAEYLEQELKDFIGLEN